MSIKNNNKNNEVAFKSTYGKNEVIKYYDMLLTNWSFNHDEYYINTCCGETFILACGNKELPPLILLHGSGMNSVMWINEMIEYSKSFRVYAVDIPGEPGKSDENQISFEGDDFSDWLKDVFDSLLIKRANIVGLSLGGWLATKFSIKYQDRVNKLVVLCPAGIGNQKKLFAFKALFYILLGDRGLEKLYYKINGDKPIPRVIFNYQKLIAKYFNFRKVIIPKFSDNELKTLKIPVSLFVGGKDIMLNSYETAERLSTLVKHANINILEDEGHTLINQGESIREFLNQTKY